MKSAIIHDWLLSNVGGSENCLREIYDMFPSPIYTLLWNQEAFRETSLAAAAVHTSFIERLPWAKNKFRSYLPLFPVAIEQFDLSSYDLILSSSHCIAKGVITHPDQLHLCYCYTPMRYAWDLSHEYLREAGLEKGFKGAIAKAILHYLRGWDVHSSHRVDHYIAISNFVARRIQRVYGKRADVIYPPVNTDFFRPGGKKEEFYLTASRLVSYKKIDMIVAAFSRMPDRKLVVIGDGPEMTKIKNLATPNVELMGYQSNNILLEMMQKAKAFVFAGIEDFGIIPLEAMAAGVPVIALKKGGAAELITNETGVFFEDQTQDSLMEAISRFEAADRWDIKNLREHSLKFSYDRFRREFKDYVHGKMMEFNRCSATIISHH